MTAPLTLKLLNSHSLLCRPHCEYVPLLVRFAAGFGCDEAFGEVAFGEDAVAVFEVAETLSSRSRLPGRAMEIFERF